MQLTETEFDKITGVIFDQNELPENAPLSDQGSGNFETYQLDELVKFVSNNNEYHIVTAVDSESRSGIAYCNCICIVNRITYHLAIGDKNPELTCEVEW